MYYRKKLFNKRYCRSGNIREIIIFTNLARRTNSRIQESRENYYYSSATNINRKYKQANILRSIVFNIYHDSKN